LAALKELRFIVAIQEDRFFDFGSFLLQALGIAFKEALVFSG
jgi:predicted Co/Zn/Cd cation transporter (cation efflux family)